jgi:hypothetical protein
VNSNPQSAIISPYPNLKAAKRKRRGSESAAIASFDRRGYASRAVIGTLRPTERRRATHRKWVDRISSLELYVLPKETGNRSRVSAQPVFQVACQNGAEGARTPDLLGAIQALSQLSYSPAHAGTGEHTRSLAPGSPEDNSPATFAGPRSSCWMITAFAGRVKRTPCLLDGPATHPSRVNVPTITRSVPTIFNTCKEERWGAIPRLSSFPKLPTLPPELSPHRFTCRALATRAWA